VKGRPAYFGDYFNLQTDQFIFPAFNNLGAVIRGEGSQGIWRDYETLMGDDETATRFSRGQHAGSLGPATALSKQVDISDKSALLDVAGGSGAFTIMLCKRNPNLSATIFDFPAALTVARHFVAEAGLDDRVEFVVDVPSVMHRGQGQSSRIAGKGSWSASGGRHTNRSRLHGRRR
jgi:hypothetical protein